MELRPVSFRPEIQGVRALAVSAVLVFHVWPWMLPGGYIGVDVFFVVSGYLITGLLLREAEAAGRISLSKFYAKRIKRLLPAATVVLAAVATCISVLPVLRWEGIASEVAASALYFENWWLAAAAVDYLSQDNAPSPVQHFWSLSVEEQYYIVWPLMFAAAGAAGSVRKFGARATFAGLTLFVGGVSLAYSIYITPRDPGLAYFATTTRAWELALGAGLAVCGQWQRLSDPARQAMGVAGLIMVAVAAFAFDSSTVFPGSAALLPTVGAALLVISGPSDSRVSLYGLLRSAPMQYVGDLSYSLYLWHWPAVVFYRHIAGRDLTLIDGLIVIAVSVALAHQTKVLVEDRFRSPSFASASKWRPYGFAAACISIPLVCWAVVNFQLQRIESIAKDTIVTSETPVPGLRSPSGMREECREVARCAGMFSPSLARVRDDVPRDAGTGCHASQVSDDPTVCSMGDYDAPYRVYIVGDSHAAQWRPALEAMADAGRWRVDSYTKSACSLSDVVVRGGRSSTGAYTSCRTWTDRVIESIRRSPPDLLIISQSVAYKAFELEEGEDNFDVLVEGYQRTWSQIDNSAVPTVVLADTPRLGFDVPECLAANGATFDDCSRPSHRLLARRDPTVVAAATLGLPIVSMNDLICPGDTCPAVVDGTLVWRDSHHITASFARQVGPELVRRVVAAVGQDD